MSYINKIGKNASWRKHVTNNLVTDVILYEKIITSPKIAKDLTKIFSKLIEWAKKNDLHSRRLALRYLVIKKHFGVLNKLFVDLKKRYNNRKGGYTRIIKNGYKLGDNSPKVIFSLI